MCHFCHNPLSPELRRLLREMGEEQLLTPLQQVNMWQGIQYRIREKQRRRRKVWQSVAARLQLARSKYFAGASK